MRDTAVSAFNSFGVIRVCAAEPRPDFRYRSNANDGKAMLCRVLTRGLAPKRKRTGKTCCFLNHICFFLRDTAVSAFNSFCSSVYARRSLGRIFAVAQMRTTAKPCFAAYSLEDSLQTKKNRQNLLYFQIIFVFYEIRPFPLLILLGLSVLVRRSLGRIFAVAQMRTTAKPCFAAYSLEDSLQTKKNRQNLFFFVWSGKRDSNSRHLPWQGNALPLSHSRILVGTIGLEPMTPCL